MDLDERWGRVIGKQRKGLTYNLVCLLVFAQPLHAARRAMAAASAAALAGSSSNHFPAFVQILSPYL